MAHFPKKSLKISSLVITYLFDLKFLEILFQYPLFLANSSQNMQRTYPNFTILEFQMILMMKTPEQILGIRNKIFIGHILFSESNFIGQILFPGLKIFSL